MDLYALSRAYPLVTLAIAAILFIIGFKIAKKLLWILAFLVLTATIILFFL